VSNSKGTTTSSNTVRVNFDDGATAAPTSVLVSPTSQYRRYKHPNTSVTATVTIDSPATNNATLKYQWYRAVSGATTVGATLLEGETASTLRPDTSIEGISYYYVVVSNSKAPAGITSNIVEVEVDVACVPDCDMHLDDICFSAIRQVNISGTTYTLIVSRRTVVNTPYNSSGDYRAWEDPTMADGSYTTARTTMNNWYAALSPTGEIRSRAVVPTNVRSESAYHLTISNPVEGYSAPTATKPSGTADIAFCLSFSEANDFMTQAQYGGGQMLSAGSRNWWLRSPGYTAERVRFVAGSTADIRNGNFVTTMCAIRPALWVE